MKTLILVRHGEAERNRTSDFERELVEAGRREVRVVAEAVKKGGGAPAQCVSSPAARAWQTAGIWCEVFAIDAADVVARDEIYDASLSELLDVVADLDDEAEAVALFGHNPGFAALAAHFAPEKVHAFGTGAAWVFAFEDAAWRDVAEGAVRPRAIRHHPPR